MTDKHIKKITGFKVDKATEDELMDFSRYELVDIILAYREEYNELTRVHTKLNEKLQAKEQECERLENENKRLVGELANPIFDSFEELDQLKAENDELRTCYKNNLLLLGKQETNTTKLVNKVMKLEKTLTELGTILTHCMQQDICTTCDYSEECNLGDEEIPTYDICKFLLNKINQHQ